MRLLIPIFFMVGSFLSASEQTTIQVASSEIKKEKPIKLYLGNTIKAGEARRSITTMLKDPSIDVNMRFPHACEYLIHIATLADTSGELLRQLLERGAKVSQNHYERQPNVLQLCARSPKYLNNARLLIERAPRKEINHLLNDRVQISSYESGTLPLEVAFRKRNKEICQLYLHHNASGNLAPYLFQGVKNSQSYAHIKEIIELFKNTTMPENFMEQIVRSLQSVRELYTTSEHLEPLHQMLLDYKAETCKILEEARQKREEARKKEESERKALAVAAVTPGEPVTACIHITPQTSPNKNGYIAVPAHETEASERQRRCCTLL